MYQHQARPGSTTTHRPSPVAVAIGEMLAGYPGLIVQSMTVATYRRALSDYPEAVAIAATRIVPKIYVGRYPNAGDVELVARSIDRYGVAAVTRAAATWWEQMPESESTRTAPAPKQWDNACKLAHKAVGNPDRRPLPPPPEATGDDEHEGDPEWDAKVSAKMAALGLSRDDAAAACAREAMAALFGYDPGDPRQGVDLGRHDDDGEGAN